jgi:hypothetical protein
VFAECPGRVPDLGTRQTHSIFAECPDLALGKVTTALPSALVWALGKGKGNRPHFKFLSIQNLFKHISLNIIQHFITKLIFHKYIKLQQKILYCFNEFSYISICMN